MATWKVVAAPKRGSTEVGYGWCLLRKIDPLDGISDDVLWGHLPSSAIDWAVSADGLRVVLVSSEGRASVLNLATGELTELSDLGDGRPRAATWALDGSLIVSSFWSGGRVGSILHADLEGNTYVLWTSESGFARGSSVSPDGGHLAFSQVRHDADIWLLEPR